MTTPLPNPDMPNPFDLKKKTVKFPDASKFINKDPALYELAMGQAEAQEDRNTMLAAQQWNNLATFSMLEGIKERLAEGDELLKEVRLVRKIAVWALSGIGGILVLALGTILANWVSHMAHWT